MKQKTTKHQDRVKALTEGKALETPEYGINEERGAGKPTLYDEYVIVTVERLAAKGLTNRDIAKNLCIGERTFYEWLERYPQLAHALKKYRGLADIEVENALYRNAVGYNYQEQVTTNRGAVVTVNKYHAGNPTAQIFYLKNRMPQRYRDKIEHELTVSEDISQMAFMIKRREE